MDTQNRQRTAEVSLHTCMAYNFLAVSRGLQ